MLLSQLGIEHHLVSALPTTSVLPKAHVLNQRSMEILRDLGVGASYRRSHGSDIEAACGQLAVAGARARRRQLRRQTADA